jgi:hypothetical protein
MKNLKLALIIFLQTIGKETDGRFVATISSKVNERITINGKGVPFGGINESAIVGDLEKYRVKMELLICVCLMGE